MMTDDDLIRRVDAIAVLVKAQIASCNCDMKTPDPDWHRHDCRYRILREAEAMIEHVLPAALSAAPEVQALVEAAVKRALEAAAASIRAEEKSSVYYQGRVQTFCYGMRDGFESSAQVAEGIAANPAEVRRIAEGRDE